MKLRAEIVTATELVAGAAVSAVLNFATLVLVARRLGPAAYADFASAISFIFISTVALSPLAPAIARVVAGHADDLTAVASLRRRLLFPLFLAGAGVSVLALLIARPLAEVFHLRSAGVVTVAFATVGAFVVVSSDRAFLHGLGRFRSHNINTIVEAVTRIVLTIIVLRLTLSPAAALAPYLLSLIVAEVVLAVALGAFPAGSDRLQVRHVLRTSRPLFVLMLSAAVLQNADMLAVKRWLPVEVAGHYGAASAVTRGFGVLFVPLYVMSGPILVTARKSGGSIAAVTFRLAGYFLAAAIIPLGAMFLYGSEVMTQLYGAAYAPAGAIVGRLAIAVVTGYLALLVAQAHVTADDRLIPFAYAAVAALLVFLLALFHASVDQILMSLFATNGVLLLLAATTLRRLDDRAPLQ